MQLLSILKKVLMALTGLAWFGFLVVHLLGNLLLLQGPETFNMYSATLHRLGGVLYVAEFALVAFLLVHIYSGIRVTIENRRARKRGYAVSATAGKATLASRTMALGGIAIAVFVVVHVAMFKYGDIEGNPNGLWGLVVDTFNQPIWVVTYIAAMMVVGLHLSHGLGSAFQTLGILKPRWRPRVRMAGVMLGWAIALAFSFLPIWCYLVPSN